METYIVTISTGPTTLLLKLAQTWRALMTQVHVIYVIIHIDSGFPSPRWIEKDQPAAVIRRALSTGGLLNRICVTTIHSNNRWT